MKEILDFAYLNYNNLDEDEFLEDFRRLSLIKKGFNDYRYNKTVNYRLLINHHVIIFNIFSKETAITLLFSYLSDYINEIATCLMILGRIPSNDICLVNGNVIKLCDIKIDEKLLKALSEEVSKD